MGSPCQTPTRPPSHRGPYRAEASTPPDHEERGAEQGATWAAVGLALVPLVGVLFGARFSERESMLAAVVLSLAIVCRETRRDAP